jgi:hypothetical protein
VITKLYHKGTVITEKLRQENHLQHRWMNAENRKESRYYQRHITTKTG